MVSLSTMCYGGGMKVLVLGAALLLGGCAQQFLNAATRECSAFGYPPGTPAYANCVQQRYSVRQMQMSAALTNAGRQMAAQSPSSSATAFLRSDYVNGTARVCTYDRMGSPYVMTVSAAQICPVSVP